MDCGKVKSFSEEGVLYNSEGKIYIYIYINIIYKKILRICNVYYFKLAN